MSDRQHFLFRPVDSWFFREPRSMDGSGATALDSIFPPANNTLLGALRAQIGNLYHDKNGTDWHGFRNKHDACRDLSALIGFGNDYAGLRMQGSWLYHEGEKQLYFPLPMSIVTQAKSGQEHESAVDQYDFFNFDAGPVSCDLGTVYLPELKERGDDKRDAPVENAYISTTELESVLQGRPPKKIVKQEDVFESEARLGIERDNQRRKTIDGKLYQTKHLRLKKGWKLYLGLDGLGADYRLPETILRLGGEARMAVLETLDSALPFPEKPVAQEDTKYLLLYLLTPLRDFERGKNQAVLPNAAFQCAEKGVPKTWGGAINGVNVEILSAITGKSERIGGWDMVNHQSLPVRSFIPAGSCWYVRSDNPQAVIDALHGTFITEGNERALGYGQLAVGLVPTI